MMSGPAPDDHDPETPCRPYPLQGYAALGDGRTLALIAPGGTVAWWCVPDLDSDPLFDCLLDADAGGYFALAPTEPYRAERRYRPGSNVLETVFTTASGSVRVTESINSTLAGRLPWCELARRVEGLSGTVTMRVRLVFGTRGDAVSPWLEPNPNGCLFHAGPVLGQVRTSANMPMLADDRTVTAEATLRAGGRAMVAVIAGEDEPLGVPAIEEIDARIDVSDGAWRAWAEGVRYDGPYRDPVLRSALALKLLLFSPTGAIAAAGTTGLPEKIGGPKNWDYRYAWVRDAAYALTALVRLGQLPEAKAALSWLVRRLGETGAKVCYRLDGGPVPPVEELDLPGYRGSRPVLIGNAAGVQHQHGVYGDIFQAAADFVAAGNVLDRRTALVLMGLGDECADRWRRKDAGMWELEQPRHYTMSKVSCWQALNRAVELAEAGHLPATCVPRWQRERERIAAWVDEHCWSAAKRAYTFFAGTERLDASLVLAVSFGFDRRERLASTVDAIQRELASGPWVYRYSGAEAEEGAFLACTFWLAEALAKLGRRAEGRALMEAALSGLPAGPGVLAEMVETETGDLVGNLPQGLSHLALIHAAIALNEG
jgi:GH15 family glucan-1,4-alpha-glucosidase